MWFVVRDLPTVSTRQPSNGTMLNVPAACMVGTTSNAFDEYREEQKAGNAQIN
jgi:hypothetical protein